MHLLALEGPDVEAIEAAVQRHRPALLVGRLAPVRSRTPSWPSRRGSLAQVRGLRGAPDSHGEVERRPAPPGGARDQGRRLGGAACSGAPRRHRALVRGRSSPRVAAPDRDKHRYGPTGEVGLFEMRDEWGRGARPRPRPAHARRPHGGRAGQRGRAGPAGKAAPPRRGAGSPGPRHRRQRRRRGWRPHTLGIDAARANLLVAVLACRTVVDVPVPAQFFVAAVGGISVTEPAADLAVVLAMASVVRRQPVPAGSRGVRRAGPGRGSPHRARRRSAPGRGAARRLRRGALAPTSTLGAATAAPAGLVVHGVRTLAEALDVAGPEAGVQTGPGTMPGWPRVRAAANR